MRRLIVSLLAAGCALGLAACGGGSTSTGTATGTGTGATRIGADIYTSSVCTTIGAWRQQLESAGAALTRRTNTAKSLAHVRTEFVTYFDGAIDETDKMLGKVEQAGVPDVNDGEEVTAALLRSLRRFRPVLVEARAKARRLPVGDERKFTIQTQTLGAPFVAELAKLSTLWETLGRRYDAPELTSAANASAVCGAL